MTDYPEPPETLLEKDIWLVWKREEREKSDGSTYLTKVPLDPDTGHDGDATDEGITVSFERAVEAESELDAADGIGFAILPNDLLVGTDLDDVRDPETGQLNRLGREVMTALDSYTEVSPSGTGLHVVTLGFKPGDRCRRSLSPKGERDGNSCEIEMYDDKRFFTYTGQRVDAAGFDVVEQRNDAIDEVYDEFLGDTGSDNDTDNGEWDGEAPDLDLDDEQVLEKARNAKNGDKFSKLERGSDAMHQGPDGPDTSRADQAFVNYLAFYTGGDRQQIDRLFRASGRMRDKWDPSNHSTYAEQTIDAALKGRTEFYNPARKGSDGPDVTGADEALDAATDGGAATSDGTDTDTDGDSGTPSRSIESVITYDVLEPLTEDEGGIDSQTAINRTAEAFDDEWHFVKPERSVTGWRETLYVYDPAVGVYEPRGKEFIGQRCEDLLGAFATNNHVREIAEKITRRNTERGSAFETGPERLVVGNGILDLTEGELDPHTPHEYHTVRVDVDYNPEATCEDIDEWFGEVVEDDDVGTLYRIAAHSLYREYISEKAVMLVGSGQNGKSIYTWLLETLLNPERGRRNTSSVSLSDVSENDFSINQLHGKLANINSDINSADVQNLGKFKQLTGRDRIMADVKYETPIVFENYATMVFSVNQMPSFAEDTHALWRRWVYLKFPYTFEPGEEGTEPKGQIQERIGAEDQLEGLLARAVEELQEWDDGREMFPDVPSPEQIREMMLRAAEPVYDFAKVCLRESEDGKIPTDDARRAFREYARAADLGSNAAMDPSQFGKKLQSVAEFPVESSQQRIDGTPTRVYSGVELTERGKQILGGDEDAIDALDSDQSGLDPDGIGKSYQAGDDIAPPDDATDAQADADRVVAVLTDADDALGGSEIAGCMMDRFGRGPDMAKRGIEHAQRTGRIQADHEDGSKWRTT